MSAAIDFIKLSLDNMPLAASIIDTRGILTYYNRKAAELLDRKPEYIGRDIRACHQKDQSVVKIDKMMEEFRNGREQPYWYESFRYGRELRVTFTPLRLNGDLVGCLQTVRPVKEQSEESERLS